MGRFDDISRLFLEAQNLGPEEREAFLRNIEDGVLRSELSALLDSDSNAGERSFLGIKPDHSSEGLPGPGQTLGPFMIIQELGRGGMGAVFLARDHEQDRDVAIKLLHPLLWSTEDSRGELMHEAEMVGRLEHEAIVPKDGFQRVQALLRQNRRKRRRRRAQRCPGLLDGLLYCAACRSQMIHTYTTKGPCRYRYYVCSHAQKHGWDSCPSKSLPAMEVERFVMKEVQNGHRDELAPNEVTSDCTSTAEQAKLLAGLVRRVEYDGRQGELCIKLEPNGRSEPI